MKYSLSIVFGLLLIVGCKKDDDVKQSGIPDDYVAMYSLDGDAIDNSQYENHGEIVGNVSATTNRHGIPNSAMFFVNKISYIDVQDADELKLTEAITISVWVKAESLQYGWNAIVNKWKDTPGYGGAGYYLGLKPNGLQLRWNITNNIIETESPFPLNVWTHITVTYDGAVLKMYKNAKLINQKKFEGGIADNEAPFRIGHQSEIIDGFDNFHGAIDDVIVYDRALQESEINKLYLNNY